MQWAKYTSGDSSHVSDFYSAFNGISTYVAKKFRFPIVISNFCAIQIQYK